MTARTRVIALPDVAVMRRIIATALTEDICAGGDEGDITSSLLIPQELTGTMYFNARQDMVAAAVFVVGMVFEQVDGHVKVEARVEEGEKVAAKTTLVVASGPARALLTGERVALNLLQRACSIATITKQYVEATAGTRARVLDTRKTMPGLRELDKYAVRAGGGENHRMGLYDMVLIKDNHIALAGGIAAAVAKARAGTKLPVVVECDTPEQAKEAIAAKPDRILVDNMTMAMLRSCVSMAAGKVVLEASGGVNLKTVKAIAETGVQYISVGALTHSAPSVDIGADIEI